MRLVDVKKGMGATLLLGKGSKRKHLSVIVVGFRFAKRDGKYVKHVVVKPLNGGAQRLVRQHQLHAAELFQASVRRDVMAARRKQLEAERLHVFRLLVRRGIVPRTACLSDDGRVFELQIGSGKLQRLAQLLRGRDGAENSKQEDERSQDWDEWSKEDWDEWVEGADTNELPSALRAAAG